MKRLEAVHFLAHTEEAYWLAGDFTDRERHTALGIAIGLGQDDTGQRQCLTERCRCIDGVLARHAIDHEQRFPGTGRRVHGSGLLHHVAIDMQPACGIDDQHVGVRSPGLVQRTLDDGDRYLRGVAVAVQCTDLAGKRFQLQDRRGTMHVDADEHDALLVLLHDALGKFCRRSRLAGALQAGEEYDHRRLRFEVERCVIAAEYRDELVVDDLDQRLPRCEAPGNLFAERSFPDALDERLDDGQRHIGFEQREPHLPQRILDIGLGEPPLAAEAARGIGQPPSEILKHGAQSTKSLLRPAPIHFSRRYLLEKESSRVARYSCSAMPGRVDLRPSRGPMACNGACSRK